MDRIAGDGERIWLIPDGFIPEESRGSIESHEAICFLNTSEDDARVSLSFYFADRAPIKDIVVTVPAERTLHLRTGDREALGETEVPKGVPYAMRIESDIPISVQHSRLDSRQAALGLMSTMAYAVERRR